MTQRRALAGVLLAVGIGLLLWWMGGVLDTGGDAAAVATGPASRMDDVLLFAMSTLCLAAAATVPFLRHGRGAGIAPRR